MNKYQEIIAQDFNVLLGKPHIKGTRISVELILTKLAEGASNQDILAMYPHLNYEQILACIEYAANVISHDEILEFA